MLVFVGHVVSILVFLTVIASAVYMFCTLKSSTLPRCYLWVPKMVISMLIFQSVLFLLMQADYLLGPHGVLSTDDMDGYVEVLYAILNGTTLVAFATGMNVFFRWKSKPAKCMTGCPFKSYDRIS